MTGFSSKTSGVERVEWIRAALDRYEAPLVRYALRITGDLERAEDVVQDTFLRLCRENPSALRERLPQWLYTVCRNRALDVRRKEDRMRPLPEEHVSATPGRDPSPAQELEQKETISEVLALLTTLPARQQEVIRLKFQDELSYREISEVTQMSVRNVGYLIHVGMTSLRKRLRSRKKQPGTTLRRIQ